jgi:hypothetical protein
MVKSPVSNPPACGAVTLVQAAAVQAASTVVARGSAEDQPAASRFGHGHALPPSFLDLLHRLANSFRILGTAPLAPINITVRDKC